MDQVIVALPDVVARYRRDLELRDAGLRLAEGTLAAWDADAEAGDGRILDAMAQSGNLSPFALSCGERPLAAVDPPAFATVTVVAADGSSIDVDRFAPVPCWVVNIGEVVLPYGSGCDARLRSRVLVGPDDVLGERDGRGRGVTLRRDVAELRAGMALGSEASAAGDAVLLLDGTLLPWDLDSSQVSGAVRKQMEEETRDALELGMLAGLALSMGSYVSGSRAGDVVTSLRALSGDSSPDLPEVDAPLFARLLGDGQRSALFRTATCREQSIEQRFGPDHQVRFFYLRVADDIARVELPRWAASPAQLARLHATLIDQCRRCGGYPRALQEAHEQAVISGSDRQQFARLLETEAARQGLHAAINGKQASKRRRAL